LRKQAVGTISFYKVSQKLAALCLEFGNDNAIFANAITGARISAMGKEPYFYALE
jgi:hypothetical protein